MEICQKDNSADLVSRGMTAECLIKSELWFWRAPFLRKPEAEWPNTQFETIKVPSEETAMKIVLNCNNTDQDQESFLALNNHGNSFLKLQRVVATIIRSTKILRGIIKRTEIPEFLRMSELDKALNMIMKEIQRAKFQSDIDSIKKEGHVKNTSRIASFTPFIDSLGMLRVGGCLEAAEIPYGTKHPVLISGDHIYAKLLMNYLHVLNLHAGPQALLACARQRFWITQGRNLARSVVNSCVQCARAKPQLMNQLMGNLPARRVLPGRPFLTTGVDFCGPIWTHFKLRGK